jgi:hypothetical protein
MGGSLNMENLAKALAFTDLILPTGAFSGMRASQLLVFGDVLQGKTARKQVTIINDTNEILVNVSVSVRGTEFWFNPNTFNSVLPAESLCFLDFEFTPPHPGHFVGFATVLGDDSTGTQTVTIRLEGNAVSNHNGSVGLK